MAKITKAAAFEAGKGLVLAGGLWYYEGVFHQTGLKGAVPVKAVNQAKLKADHAKAIEEFNSTIANTTVTVNVVASPAGMTNHQRREWVTRFARAARIQGVYGTV